MPFLSVGPAESLASAMSASVKAAHPYARSTWRTIQHLGTNTRSSCSGIPVPAWAFLDCRRNGQARLSEVGDVRFSNRPFGVKHFQTIHHCNVDVARGLVLLFGIGTRALPSWDSRTRRNNLCVGLAVLQTVGPSGHTNSPHPSSREGHPSTAGWISCFSYRVLI